MKRMSELRNHHLTLEGVSFEPLTREEDDEIRDLHRKLVREDIYGVGPVTAAKIVYKYRTHSELVEATADGLAAIDGISERGAKQIHPEVVEVALRLSIR